MLTNGTSMYPTIRPGSVVVVRKESSYRVGEIVAYHNPDLHAVVFHRIVGRDGSKYVFKGDNNPFPDFYEPTNSDLIGAKWIYWPTGGRALSILRTPWLGAAVLGLLTLWALASSDEKPADADSEDERPRGRRFRRSPAS
jgi:signal peptidase I